MNRFTFRLRARHGLRLVAIGIGLAVLFVSDAPTQGPAWPSLVSRAEAIIGRPLTPLSYAGVARRTTRRDYGAYAAPYVAAPYVAAPRAGCVRVVDAYGRVTWRCV